MLANLANLMSFAVEEPIMLVNMHDAKSQLSKLVQAVLDGEEVILARNGEPVVQITKYAPVKPKRKPGSLKGKIWLADDWDSPETNRMINEMAMKTRIFPDEPDPHAVSEPAAVYKATPKKRTTKRIARRKP